MVSSLAASLRSEKCQKGSAQPLYPHQIMSLGVGYFKSLQVDCNVQPRSKPL